MNIITITEVVIVDHGPGNELPDMIEEELIDIGNDLSKAAEEELLKGRQVLFDGTFVSPQKPNHPFCLWRVQELSPEQAVKLVLDIIEQVTEVRPSAHMHVLERII